MTQPVAGLNSCPRCSDPIMAGATQCAGCFYPSTPPHIVRAYESRWRWTANRAYKANQPQLAKFGYVPVPKSVEWHMETQAYGNAAAEVGRRLLGSVGYLLFPPIGRLQVTYRRSDLTEQEALARPSGEISWGS